MTENKRFRIYQDLYEDFYIEDIESYYNQKFQRCYKVGNEEDIKYENVESIVNLLNEQSDKITEQVIQIDFLKDENKHMRQVLKENRQLKQQLEKYDKISKKICNWDFDEIVKVIDAQNETEKENEQLKQQINDIRLYWNQDYRDFNKDTLCIEDHNTKIKLKNGKLYIEVFIPKHNEYLRFNYIVTGRTLKREYNTIKGDVK